MVSTADILRHLYPTAAMPLDIAMEDDAGTVRISRWNTAKLGPQPTQAEIDAARPAAQAAADAEAADLASYEADKATMKAGIYAAATRLQEIRDTASTSNAQVVAAVRDMANIQLQTIKALRRML